MKSTLNTQTRNRNKGTVDAMRFAPSAGSPQQINQAGPEWIDISVPLRDVMVHWPGDPPVNIRRVRDMGQGEMVNLSMISMSAHSGTHMDAPLHFIQGGMGIDQMPLDIMASRARVLEIKDKESVKLAELRRYNIRRRERILFKTRNSTTVWQTNAFVEDFVFISDDAARYLVDCGVALVGIDYLSVGSFKNGGSYVHQTLLGGGVWIIEGLDLSQVSPGEYDLICLPLKLEQGDGAPARAMIRPIPAE